MRTTQTDQAIVLRDCGVSDINCGFIQKGQQTIEEALDWTENQYRILIVEQQ